MPPKKVKKVMTLPINVIFSHLQVCICSVVEATITPIDSWNALAVFRFIVCKYLTWNSFANLSCTLQKKTRVRLWLYEDARMQIEGQIIGFDEYMK